MSADRIRVSHLDLVIDEELTAARVADYDARHGVPAPAVEPPRPKQLKVIDKRPKPKASRTVSTPRKSATPPARTATPPARTASDSRRAANGDITLTAREWEAVQRAVGVALSAEDAARRATTFALERNHR